VKRLGRKILRAIQGQEIMAIQEHHRFQRLAALELSKDTLKDRAEPLGRDGVKYLAPVGVARDPLNPVAGGQIACDPLLVKGEERGRFEGKHRECCHQRICSSNVCLAPAVIRDVRKTVLHQAKEGISREMLSCFGSNKGHGTPHHEHIKAGKSGGIFALMFTKGQCS
jgi:hypothetical protein